MGHRMRHRKRSVQKVGLPPGSLVASPEAGPVAPVRMHLIRFDQDQVEEQTVTQLTAIPPIIPGKVSWLNIDGVHDVATVRAIGDAYKIHPLILEDILNTEQRPKCEQYDQTVYVVVHLLEDDVEHGRVLRDQVSLVFGDDFVLSFQERPGDVFDILRDRIRTGKGIVRRHRGDYLAYALVDATVDHYFVLAETLEDRVDVLQAMLLDRPHESLVQAIHGLRREVARIRRSVWPMRSLIETWIKLETGASHATTRLYLRDVHDHVSRVLDDLNAVRDTITSLLDTYLSLMSQRMNEVMKVLTVIATIFMPLTFVVGVYGMNFDYMPELHWPWSYPILWGVLGVAGLSMGWYFKRKKWI